MNGWENVKKYRVHPAYATLPLAKIWRLGQEVNRVAQPEAHMWMWATKDFLHAALDMGVSWGWLMKQIVPWHKVYASSGESVLGPGHWLRNCVEFLILWVNSSKMSNRPLLATTTPNHISAPLEGHSRKPDVFYEMIRGNSPGPRVSLFQRDSREGFDGWGNEYWTLGGEIE